MFIREYQTSDCIEITELFYNTVHTVNAKDYTKEQLDVWATGQVDLKAWNQLLQEHFSIVAVDNDIIVGFGDIDETGYLDHLFVHADYQRKGIATAICDQLEQAVQGDITTHASITAKPFFEKRGYMAVKQQQVERQGVFLTNYVMKKGKMTSSLGGPCQGAMIPFIYVNHDISLIQLHIVHNQSLLSYTNS